MRLRNALALVAFCVPASAALAAPVQVSVEDGVLVLRGDDGPNHVTLSVNPDGNVGVQTDGSSSTVEGVTEGIDADLNGSDDSITIFGNEGSLRSMIIRTGTGDDFVGFFEEITGLELVRVEAGDDDDEVRADFVEFEELQISLGRGNDRFFPEDVTAGKILLKGGAGDDVFDTGSDSGVLVTGDLKVEMEGGNDAVVLVEPSPGVGVLSVRGSGATLFHGGGGEDALDLRGGSFDRRPTIKSFETVVR